MKLKMEQFRLVSRMLEKMHKTSRIGENKKFIQHGTTSVYTHCRNVAFMSLKLARKFHVKVDSSSMVRGALLHDYFLYDWHDPEKCVKWHGFTHPKIALENALKVYDLNDIEKDVIERHMFPLTIKPPKTKEGFLVSIADKLCGIYETFKWNENHYKKRLHLVEKFHKRNTMRALKSGFTLEPKPSAD